MGDDEKEPKKPDDTAKPDVNGRVDLGTEINKETKPPKIKKDNTKKSA